MNTNAERTRSNRDRLPKGGATTGTTSIGLTTAEGVIVASDMRVSLDGRFVLQKQSEKIKRIHDRAVVTLVGLIGSNQQFARTLRSEAALYETRRDSPMSIAALQELAATLSRRGPYRDINPIIGGIDDDGPRVASIDPNGGVLSDEYVVTGSGMQLAYGYLEQHYERGLSAERGTRIATEAVRAAISRDTASGGGVLIVQISDSEITERRITDFDDASGPN